MKKFKNKFAIKFNDPVLGEAMKKKLIEIGHEWSEYTPVIEMGARMVVMDNTA